MYNSKSRCFTLFVVVLTLSVQTFGQTPAVAPPSPIPPDEQNDRDAVLKAVSDIAKATIEADRVTMEKTAAFYQQSTEQMNQLFTYGTTFVVAIAAIASFFGYKSLREYIMDKSKELAAEFSKKLEDEVSAFSKKLEDEVRNKFRILMAEIQVKAGKTLRALAKNSDAHNRIILAVSLPEQKDSLHRSALESVEESLQIGEDVDPTPRANAYAMRAYLRREQGDIKGALSDITAALDLVPNVASYYYNAACYNNLSENHEKARKLLETACALNPTYRQLALTDSDLTGL